MQDTTTIVLSVIFPENLKYFPAFLKSLENQTVLNFKLLLINDGVSDLDEYMKNTKLFYEVHSVQHLTPFEIRIQSLKLVAKLPLTNIIFADTDDTFSANRVEVLAKKLKDYVFVCNDIDIMNENGVVVEKSYWGKRLEDHFEFDIQFIKDKNLIGLGNAGLQNSVLDGIIKKMLHIREGNDWLFFSAAEHSLKVIFLKECSTHYRQHDNNIIGKKEIDLISFKMILESKIRHYLSLKKIGFNSYNIENEINLNQKLLQLTLIEPEKMLEKINQINSLETNFFWWEESNYIN